MILGITGTNGAGKGAVVDYLVEKKGFAHYSLRALIVEEIERRGLPIDRTNMGAIGTELRQQRGPSYFTELCIERARDAGQKDAIIESIRAMAEADNIKGNGGFIIAVDAPQELRYERIVGRGTETDRVSLEEFQFQEEREMAPKDANDPTQMNMRKVIDTADYILVNDGTLEELAAKIETMLADLAAR